MTRKKRRLIILLLCGLGLGSATGLSLLAFRENLVFFRAPSDVARETPSPDRAFRLGGLVETGSVERGTSPEGRPTARFRVTDGAHTIQVAYTGVLPDLFGEGQGMIALGQMQGDTFVATEVLAKHDETYMPKEVVDALKEQGVYVDPGAKPAS